MNATGEGRDLMSTDDRTWTGTRTPNKRIAFFVLCIGACLVAVAVYRWSTVGDFNWFFLIVFLLFLFIYVFLVQSTAYGFMVVIKGEDLFVHVTERLWIWTLSAREESVPRWMMSRLREITLGDLAHTVKIEDASRKTLVQFPRFLPLDEHDAMIREIIDWGNQASSSDGGDLEPLAEAR